MAQTVPSRLRILHFVLILLPLLEPTAQSALAQTITLLPEATVDTAEIAIGQVARIVSPIEGEAEQLGKLAVHQAPAVGAATTLTLAGLRDRLSELGVNRAVWTLHGASTCRINRIESASTHIQRLQDESAELRAGLVGPVVNIPEQAIPDSLVGCIRKMLQEQYLAPGGRLVLNFEPADRALLALRRPTYRFELAIRRTGEQYVDIAVQVYRGEDETAPQAGPQDPITSTTVRVRAELSAPVVVAGRLINRGQVIGDEDVRVSIRPIGLTSAACRDPAAIVGQQARRVIRPDDLINSDDLTPLALVHRNRLVTVWSRRGGVLIRTVGRAMADGVYGQRVLVRNEVSRQPFYAVVTGPDTVELDPTPVQEANRHASESGVAVEK